MENEMDNDLACVPNLMLGGSSVPASKTVHEDVPAVKPKRNSDKRPLKDDYVIALTNAQIEVKRMKVIIERHHEGNVFTRIMRAIQNRREAV